MTATVFLPGTLCDERVWLPVWRKLNLYQRRYVPLQWATSFDDMMALTSDRVLPDEKVHMVGFSMGGYVATEWAKRNPDSLASLTLVGYAAQGFDESEVKRRKQLVHILEKGQFKADEMSYIESLVHPSFHSDSMFMNYIKEMSADLGGKTLLAHVKSTTPRQNRISELNTLSCPIHIVAGDNDPLTPRPKLEEMETMIKGASLHLLKDTSHMSLLERPQAVANLLQSWLA